MLGEMFQATLQFPSSKEAVEIFVPILVKQAEENLLCCTSAISKMLGA